MTEYGSKIPKVKVLGDGLMWTRVFDEDGNEIPFIEKIAIEEITGGNTRLARITLVREIEFGE